ncbi:Copper resistance protein K [Cupriavidus necator]|uniref:Copper resistance protein K n=1 Tax=Cupriavidus necator TaxID=106590 RepID=A0A1K0J9V7_CUPNE|nr:Copper resistance protein K [Cupriavidus necator]
MRKYTLPLLMLLSLSAFAAQEQTIELKDGGKIMVLKDGTMVHIDAAGKRVRMRDNVVMEAKDGTKFMMKNNAIWKQLTEKGTLKP